MRVAPIGLCPTLDKEEVFDIAARAAAQTHGHPSGYISAGFLAALIRDTLDGISPGVSANKLFPIAHQWPGFEEKVKAIDNARKLPTDHVNDRDGDIAEIGQGWVGDEALGIALYAVFVSSNFVDAMRIAANHDGDSDSTASIAGQVHGAWKGLEGVPNTWIRRLDVLVPLLEIARRMIEEFDGLYVGPIEEDEPVLHQDASERRFSIVERQWYAVDFIADDVPGSLEDSYGYSPIFALEFLAKKSGDRLFDLSFFHANYPAGVRDKTYQLQTVHRGEHFLLAKTTNHPDVRFLCFHELTENWARKHFKVRDEQTVQDWLMEQAPREYFFD